VLCMVLQLCFSCTAAAHSHMCYSYAAAMLRLHTQVQLARCLNIALNVLVSQSDCMSGTRCCFHNAVILLFCCQVAVVSR
jgi:hypothetical protein